MFDYPDFSEWWESLSLREWLDVLSTEILRFDFLDTFDVFDILELDDLIDICLAKTLPDLLALPTEAFVFWSDIY